MLLAMLKRVLRWGDLGFCLLLLGLAVSMRPRTLSWWLGVALAAGTLPLWIVARLQLGGAFSLGARADRLVTHGLYAKVRHPIYLFGCIAYFGSLLALQSWPILALWLTLTPIELLRIRREERALEARFGPEYDQYRSSTWF